MALTPPVSLDEFKAHLNISTNPDPDRDPVLTRKLAAATDLVEAEVGAMVTRSETEQVFVAGSALVLSGGPLISATSVTDAAGAPVALDVLTVDEEARMLLFASPAPSAGPYDVTYEVGRGPAADVPEALKEATLVVAEQLYSASARGPVPQTKFTENAGTPRGFAFPRRAKELCAPYTAGWVAT